SSLSHRSPQCGPVHIVEFSRVTTHFFKCTATCLFDKHLYLFRNTFLKKFAKRPFARAELVSAGWNELLKLPPNPLALDGFAFRVLPLRLYSSQCRDNLFTEEVCHVSQATKHVVSSGLNNRC